ncbi:hypothetical protein ACOSQ3_031758 [Xanthoceras sorbifolium]
MIHILCGLDPEFKEIANAVRARETPTDFEELHEKILNHKGSLKREAARTNDNPIIANLQPNQTKTAKEITLSQVAQTMATNIVNSTIMAVKIAANSSITMITIGNLIKSIVNCVNK